MRITPPLRKSSTLPLRIRSTARAEVRSARHRTRVDTAEHTVIAGIVERPKKELLAHSAETNHFRAGGKLIGLAAPEEESEADQQDSFHDTNADLDVCGGVVGDAAIVSLGIPFLAEADEDIGEKMLQPTNRISMNQ